jgi:hypothetical protein
MPSLQPRSLGALLLFSLLAAVVVSSQKTDVVNHTNGGTHVMGYHSAFQKQPAHTFDFDYFKDSGLTARGSWKSITEREGASLPSFKTRTSPAPRPT